MTQDTLPTPTVPQNTDEQRQARLVGLQDNDGYHLCIGFVKEISPEGVVSFEDEGQKILSYGAYEVAIQDLENCLAHAKAMLKAKKKK
jgi:hypothetical protein